VFSVYVWQRWQLPTFSMAWTRVFASAKPFACPLSPCGRGLGRGVYNKTYSRIEFPMFSPLTQQLIDALRCLPGIGPKSAQRMAFQLLDKRGQAKGLALANTLVQAIEKVGNCQRCQTYTENTLCLFCQNPKRDAQQLCVVEGVADVLAVEQTNSYSGLYYVLHGHLSPLDGIGPVEIGIPALLERLKTEPIEEIIIATNPTMEGKATASYIANHVDHTKTKCSRIAHGVPLGGELEYLDSGTLTHAFYSRVEME